MRVDTGYFSGNTPFSPVSSSLSSSIPSGSGSYSPNPVRIRSFLSLLERIYANNTIKGRKGVRSSKIVIYFGGCGVDTIDSSHCSGFMWSIGGAISGIFNSLRLEYPNVACKVVLDMNMTLEPVHVPVQSYMYAEIISIMTDEFSDCEVLYKNSERHIRSYKPTSTDTDTNTGSDTASDEVAVESMRPVGILGLLPGAIIITGGMGG